MADKKWSPSRDIQGMTAASITACGRALEANLPMTMEQYRRAEALYRQLCDLTSELTRDMTAEQVQEEHARDEARIALWGAQERDRREGEK